MAFYHRLTKSDRVRREETPDTDVQAIGFSVEYTPYIVALPRLAYNT
jgi:hypothetical protein